MKKSLLIVTVALAAIVAACSPPAATSPDHKRDAALKQSSAFLAKRTGGGGGGGWVCTGGGSTTTSVGCACIPGDVDPITTCAGLEALCKFHGAKYECNKDFGIEMCGCAFDLTPPPPPQVHGPLNLPSKQGPTP